MTLRALGRLAPMAAALAGLLSACAVSPVKPLSSDLAAGQVKTLRVTTVDVSVKSATAPASLAPTLRSAILGATNRCALGSAPITLRVSVENFKTQEGAATFFLGGQVQLAGLVSLVDPASNAVRAEYYVDQVRSGGGIIGLAHLSDAENNLSREFAESICKEVFQNELK